MKKLYLCFVKFILFCLFPTAQNYSIELEVEYKDSFDVFCLFDFFLKEIYFEMNAFKLYGLARRIPRYICDCINTKRFFYSFFYSFIGILRNACKLNLFVSILFV